MLKYFDVISSKSYKDVTWESGVSFLGGRNYKYPLHYININGWHCFYSKYRSTYYYVTPPYRVDKSIYEYSDLVMLLHELQKFGKLSEQQIIYSIVYDDKLIQSFSNDVEFELYAPEIKSFIFDRQKVVTMSGRFYQNKRTMIHKFKREHPNAFVRIANVHDINDIHKIRQKWCSLKDFKGVLVHDKLTFANEISFIFSDFGKRFGKMYVCEENNEILGYVSFGLLCRDAIQTLHRQCIQTPEYKGLSDYMFVESLKLFDVNCIYINDGNGGLISNSNYFWKQHYNPVDMVNSGSLAKR